MRGHRSAGRISDLHSETRVQFPLLQEAIIEVV